jgi:uncharacterized MnhB-related membrane protein
MVSGVLFWLLWLLLFLSCALCCVMAFGVLRCAVLVCIMSCHAVFCCAKAADVLREQWQS